ncbi:MAG TPA: hypothetical protein VLK65_22200 [Vicinamibacteria bacterium]|nr:hypothetical protein [Vicinamibacteria bacterium]
MNRHAIPTLLVAIFLGVLITIVGVGGELVSAKETAISARQTSSASVFTIDCTGTKACEGEVHDCPPGQPCLIICDGLDACDDGIFNCPAGFPCTVTCEEKDACGDSTLNCSGDAPCTMECGTHHAACEGAYVACSSGPCEATCKGSQAPMMGDCDQASRCTECRAGTFGMGEQPTCEPSTSPAKVGSLLGLPGLP